MPKARSTWLAAALLALVLWSPQAGAQDDARGDAWTDFMAAGEAAFRQDNLAAARDQFEAALKAARDFPAMDPRRGLTLNNLATVYNGRGEYAKAEPLLKSALEIWELAPPPGELHLATTLHNLAGLLYAQGRYRQAEPLLRRALSIRAKSLAKDHPALVRTQKSIATLERTMRDAGIPIAQPAAPEPEAEPEPQPEASPEPATKTAQAAEPEAKPAPEAKPEPEPEAKPEPAKAAEPKKAPAPAKSQEPPPQPKVQTAARQAVDKTVAVHLASLKSVAAAQEQWKELRQAHPRLLQGLDLALQEADLGDRGVFQRVLAVNFADQASARALCDKLKAKKQYCTVVKR